jgi:hypothetical protein
MQKCRGARKHERTNEENDKLKQAIESWNTETGKLKQERDAAI